MTVCKFKEKVNMASFVGFVEKQLEKNDNSIKFFLKKIKLGAACHCPLRLKLLFKKCRPIEAKKS